MRRDAVPVPTATRVPLTAPRRRTQAERSAITRIRLLDATVESLVEKGWSGTSTTEVVRRAGVSRGAQVHHYPTKEDLVLAAVEHLLDRRRFDFRAAFDRVAPDQRTPGVALEQLWTVCYGDTFEAWLELAVAARTDPALHRRFLELQERFLESSVAAFQELFPEVTDEAFARLGLRLAFCILDGLAVNRIVGVDATLLAEVRAAFASLVDPLLTPDPTTGDTP